MRLRKRDLFLGAIFAVARPNRTRTFSLFLITCSIATMTGYAHRTARAQQQLPVIGLLSSVPFQTRVDQLSGFTQGLSETGFREGQNVLIEYRSANNELERLPGLASELVERQVNVIVTIGGEIPIIAAKNATPSIPIVFVSGNDPVRTRYVGSLNRPEGNLTGISFLVNLTVSKRLELLCEVAPKAKSIGMLVNPNNPNTLQATADAHAAGKVLGRNISVVPASTEQEIDGAFAAFKHSNIDAILVEADPFLLAMREKIVGLVNSQRLPTMYSFREFPAIGGLMSYGASLASAYRHAGVYAGRVLKGEKPAELPVAQPNNVYFVINNKAAIALGHELPPSLLARADEVIE